MRRLGSGLALCFCAVVGLAAAGVWDTKPFTEWTDKETQVVLTDSPWAGKGSLTNARSGGSFSPVPDWKITVAWRTALPIRQALVRQQIGQGGKVMAEQQAMLSAEDDAYIVSVEGLPGMYAGMMQAIAGQTSLDREGKPPLAPVKGVAQLFDKDGKPLDKLPTPPARSGGAPPGRGGFGGAPSDGTTSTLFFGFPKTDPITAADKDVEFSMNVGTYHLKHKFHLKDMVVKGEPAL